MLRKSFVAIVLVFFTSVACADYVAYTYNKKDEKIPLPKNLDKLEAKHVLNVQWGDYVGKKSRLGVLPLENRSSNAVMTVTGSDGSKVEYNYDYSHYQQNGQIPVDGIEAMVTTVLLDSGRFRLVERESLNSALSEQDLGASGRVAKPSAAKIGQVLGAEYLVKAEVTHYETDFKGNKKGLGGLVGGGAGALLGGVKLKSSKSMVGMNFRLIDATTSEVIFSKQVESIISEKGLTFGGAGGGFTGSAVGVLGGFMDNYSKTPIGQAVIAAINKGVYEVVKQVGANPASGSVIKASGNKVYINIGKNAVSNGEILSVVAKGEELIDPDTGISLGSEDEEIGSIKVTSASDKFSIAAPLDIAANQISKGDRVVSTKAPEPLEYGDPFSKKMKKSF